MNEKIAILAMAVIAVYSVIALLWVSFLLLGAVMLGFGFGS